MSNVSSTAMGEYWNGDGGLNWMSFQDKLKISLEPFGKKAISVALLKEGDTKTLLI